MSLFFDDCQISNKVTVFSFKKLISENLPGIGIDSWEVSKRKTCALNTTVIALARSYDNLVLGASKIFHVQLKLMLEGGDSTNYHNLNICSVF